MHPRGNRAGSWLPLLALVAMIVAGDGGAAGEQAAEVAARDDSGALIRLPAPARRIVSLAPHATELLFAAGAGDRIVGAVEYSDYPPRANRIERVGSSRALDIERIVRLRPDLVVAWKSGNSERQVESLRRLGLAVFDSEPRRLGDIADGVEVLGRLAGTSSVADASARAFRSRLQALAQRHARQLPVTVFHQVWASPLLTINGQHVINDVIELCGGRNVFHELSALTPTVSVEAVVRADPEVITTAAVAAEAQRALDPWRQWTRLTAVVRGNLVVIDPDVLSRQSPRILDGAAAMCAALDRARARRPGAASSKAPG